MSKILKSVHNTAKALHKAGIMDSKTMREYDSLCIKPADKFPLTHKKVGERKSVDKDHI